MRKPGKSREGRRSPQNHGGNRRTDLNLLRKPSCGARLCLRRQGRLANRRPLRHPRLAASATGGASAAMPDTLRVPRFHLCHYEKQRHCKCSSAVFGRGRRTWSPLRSGRLVACVPSARTRPSARGFGVDVGKRTGGTGEGQCCPVSNASPGEDGAGLVLWEIFRAKTGEKEREIPEKT